MSQVDHPTAEKNRDNEKSIQQADARPATEKGAGDWKLELFALSGFCLSGVVFVVSGLQNGDVLTVLGSLIWIASCLFWMLPYRRYFQKPAEEGHL